MSQSNAEKFYKVVANDPDLMSRLMQGADGPEAFIGNSLKAAKEMDLDFEFEEAKSWLIENTPPSGSGELTEAQLQAVTGGWMGIPSGGGGVTWQNW